MGFQKRVPRLLFGHGIRSDERRVRGWEGAPVAVRNLGGLGTESSETEQHFRRLCARSLLEGRVCYDTSLFGFSGARALGCIALG